MFKSSENLRHEAAQRSLDRVASTWRSSRTTWFDGTPESLAARLAATERVLTVARSGYSPAHLELTVEAEYARAELREASHRLMIDFLDDGARAFKGSRRVAGKHDADPDEPWKNQATGEDTPTEHWEKLHLSPFDDVDDYEGKHREGAKERGLRECINCEGALSGEDDDDKDSECGTCGMSAHEKGVDWRKKDAAQHSIDDLYDRAYSNRGRVDDPFVTVDPSSGINRNYPGMLDGYDGHPYAPAAPASTPYDEMPDNGPYDVSQDPDSVPSDYLGPAGRDLGGKHRQEEGY